MSGEQLALDLAGVDPGQLRAIDTGYVEDLADAINRGGRGKCPAPAVGTVPRPCRCVRALVPVDGFELRCLWCGRAP